MATVNQLIKQLSEIEDKDQTVAFQYYLANDFEHLFRDEPDVSPSDIFSEAVSLSEDYLWDHTYDNLAREITDEIERVSPNEDDEDE